MYGAEGWESRLANKDSALCESPNHGNNTVRYRRLRLCSGGSFYTPGCHRTHSHTSPEFKQHWTLDTEFNEDSSRIRRGNAPENFALLRRIALNLQNLDTSNKTSMRSRRQRAGANERCLDKTLERIAIIMYA